MGSQLHSKTGLNMRNWVGINHCFPPVLHSAEENIPVRIFQFNRDLRGVGNKPVTTVRLVSEGE